MARGGFKVLDSDTHVYEPSELMEKYLPARWKEVLETTTPPVQRTPVRGGWNTYRVDVRKTGQRRLGSKEKAEPTTPASTSVQGGGVPWGVQWKGPPFPTDKVNEDPHARVADMDIEGVDVHVIFPTRGVTGFASTDNRGLEIAMYEAYHQYIAEYCSPYPKRLKSLIMASTTDVEAGLAEIDRWGKEDWAVGILPITPKGQPLDDPDLDPIWAKAVEYDLAILVHPFNLANPSTPVDDLWDNLFLERAAGGVWAGMRGMGAIIGSGMLDKFPGLRAGVIETGHGWLASWARRLDEISGMVSYSLPPLKQKFVEYVRGPQYFHSIEMSEGEDVTKSIIDLLGDDTLMFATDYPHTECWFPISVDTVLGWNSISEESKRKMLWDNGVALYKRCEGL